MMLAENPRSVPETIGERMKKARRRSKITVDQMAARFGVAVPTVRSWEQSVRTPRRVLLILKEWAVLCDVSYGWLLVGEDVESFTYPDNGSSQMPIMSVLSSHERLFDLPPSGRQPTLSVA